MSDLKISELTAYTTPQDNDLLPIVDDVGGETKKITYSDLSIPTKATAAEVATGTDDTKYTTPLAVAGKVNGPASSTDNAVARFDSITGNLIQNSALTVTDGSGSANAILNIASVATSDKTFTLPNETGTVALRGANTFTAQQSIIQTDSTGNLRNLIVNYTLTNSSAYGGIPNPLGVSFTEQATNTRVSAQVFRFNYTKHANSTGESLAFDTLMDLNSNINANQTSPLYTFIIEEPTVASGKTLGTHKALVISAPTGDGTITTNIALAVANGAGVSGFGTDTPNANAIVEMSSTTKAFLPPRMTTTQRDAIPSPVAGMVIYNTTTNVLNFHNGTAWGAV